MYCSYAALNLNSALVFLGFNNINRNYICNLYSQMAFPNQHYRRNRYSCTGYMSFIKKTAFLHIGHMGFIKKTAFLHVAHVGFIEIFLSSFI